MALRLRPKGRTYRPSWYSSMTILIGMPFKNGIVMACDSQGSAGNVKHLDRRKMRAVSIRFPTGFGHIVLAGAGGAAYSSKAAEDIQHSCEGKLFRSPRDVADEVEDAVLAVYKRYVLDRQRKLGFEPSVTDDPPELGIMLAVSLWTGESSENGLYTIFPDGLAQSEDSYATMGTGSPYAEYLLQRMWREDSL